MFGYRLGGNLMATYTDRMHLAKPDPTDPVSVTPINNNMERIDDLINMVIGLPTNLADAPNGQLLFDESQELIALKAHGELLYLAPRVKPQGKKAFTTVTTNSSTFTNSELISTLQATFTAEATRRYVVQMLFPLRWVSGSSSTPRMFFRTKYRWAQAPSIDASSTVLFTSNSTVFGPVGTYKTFSKTFEFFPAVDGQVTIGLGIENTSTTQVGQLYAGNANREAYILVRDYGS